MQVYSTEAPNGHKDFNILWSLDSFFIPAACEEGSSRQGPMWAFEGSVPCSEGTPPPRYQKTIQVLSAPGLEPSTLRFSAYTVFLYICTYIFWYWEEIIVLFCWKNLRQFIVDTLLWIHDWTTLPRRGRFGQILIWLKRHLRVFIKYTSCYSFWGTRPGLSPNVGCPKGQERMLLWPTNRGKAGKRPCFPCLLMNTKDLTESEDMGKLLALKEVIDDTYSHIWMLHVLVAQL